MFRYKNKQPEINVYNHVEDQHRHLVKARSMTNGDALGKTFRSLGPTST